MILKQTFKHAVGIHFHSSCYSSVFRFTCSSWELTYLLIGNNGLMCLLICTGTGSGVDKWIVHFEGGGWCFDEAECAERSKTGLGSSKTWPKTASYGGLLSANKEINPDFYDWNVAFLNYCDGASFAGNV